MMCPLSEQGKQLAIEVSNILGMDVCGVDLLQLNDGSFVVCEANANVGFIAFDQACGIDVAGIIADFALSTLPSRLTRKMSLLSVVSSTSETSSEPEVCIVNMGGGSLPEAVCNMSVGSSSSESDPELAEPSQKETRFPVFSYAWSLLVSCHDEVDSCRKNTVMKRKISLLSGIRSLVSLGQACLSGREAVDDDC
ncbi:hypothetical protein XENOCAPTIV_010187 [Xenoophorus captivus]|uniref:ATP-grasp domain-containing protein n=1 Tax=Xenoophorus captivus TaxID=1517983 RepID=A0ABV0QZK2_9TELE